MTMDINERGKKYAEGKALSALNAAIEQAYIDGYNDGLKHLENEKLEAIKEGVEYVDLDLPSGTLWSSGTISDGKEIRELPYMEVSKLSIPTKEQYEELFTNCEMDWEMRGLETIGIKFTGRNGKFITIQKKPKKPIDLAVYCFWLKDDSESKEKSCAKMSIINGYKAHYTEKFFMGYNLPVMLVKKKQK